MTFYILKKDTPFCNQIPGCWSKTEENQEFKSIGKFREFNKV